jgi:hypothetical protein
VTARTTSIIALPFYHELGSTRPNVLHLMLLIYLPYFKEVTGSFFCGMSCCIVFVKKRVWSLVVGRVFKSDVRTCAIFRCEFMSLDQNSVQTFPDLPSFMLHSFRRTHF